MIRSINQYSYYSTQPNFQGKNPIDLNYILQKRSNLLPPRVLEKAQELVDKNVKPLPTLEDVHKDAYSYLLKCQSLDEVRMYFPEFSQIKNAESAFVRNTGNIKKLKENGYLNNGFTLKILQDIWVNLKTKDEIAKEMGLKNRSGLSWILDKINLVNFKPNYRMLIMSSNPITHAKISEKTTAWNKAHPDIMKAKKQTRCTVL